MGSFKDKVSKILNKIRNPECDEQERDFQKKLNIKRLVFILPFIAVAVIFLLLSFK